MRATWVRVWVLGLVAALLGAAPDAWAADRRAVVHPQVVAELESEGVGEALVVLEAADLGHAQRFGTFGLRRAAVVERLQAVAAGSQARVERVAGEHGARIVNRFWLQNMMLVRGGAGAIEALAELPEVERIIPNFEVQVLDGGRGVGASGVDGYTWGLARMGVDRVHAEFGIDGSRVRVATLDTGVAVEHPDLAGKMVTVDPEDPAFPGGWIELDSGGQPVPSEPRDTVGHGTNVAGTIHGGDASGTRIGVAPGAGMMHALTMPRGAGTFAQLIAGMQWAAAPFDRAGDPVGEPAHVVTSAVGVIGFHDEFVEPVRALRAAGVVPVLPVGNHCGDGNTVSPGNVFDAVAVGATDGADAVAELSCGGVVHRDQWESPPPDWPVSWTKPDVSAPGIDVLTAGRTGNHVSTSGTSMANAHVAGVAALLLSADPELTVDDLAGILTGTAIWMPRYAPRPPDTRYGHGRVDAYEAARLLDGRDPDPREPGSGEVTVLHDTGFGGGFGDFEQPLACVPDEVGDASFVDVGGTTHEASIACAEAGAITSGVSADPPRFAPLLPVTRGQMATFVAAMLEAAGVDLPEPARGPFADVTGTTHEANINRLSEAGIVSGQTATQYRPQAGVTRGQVATMLVEAVAAVRGVDLAPVAGPHFPDVRGVHAGNVDAAYERGILSGRSDGSFGGGANILRGQMATVVTGAWDYALVLEDPRTNIGRYMMLADLLKDRSGNAVFVGRGDDVAASASSEASGWQHMINALNASSLDVNALGAAEFDVGTHALRDLVAGSRFAWVTANLRDAETGDPFAGDVGTERYRFFDVDGVRVGVTGLAAALEPEIEDVEQVPSVDATESVIDEMRGAGVDVVVVGSGLCGDDARSLAAAVDGIDVMVGDGCAQTLDEPEVVNGTIVSFVGEGFDALGQLMLTVEDGDVAEYAFTRWDLTEHQVRPHPDVQRIVDDHHNAPDR